MSFEPYLRANPFGSVPTDFGKRRFDFIDETLDGGLDKSLHPGVAFGPWFFNFNQTSTVPIGNAVVVPTNGSGSSAAFVCADHGLAIGDSVRLETNGVMPTGFENNTYYYVVGLFTPVPGSFGLSATNGGLPLPYIDSGIGDLVIFKRGMPYDFTDWAVNAWVKNNPTDEDVDKVLDLTPTFSINVPGQVIIIKLDETSELLEAKCYWDFVLTTPDAAKLNVFVANRFDIVKTVTHPFV